MSNWTKILLTIPEDFYLNATEKALCFKLWGKKFIAFPKKFIDGKIVHEFGYWTFTMPHWYVEEHGLRSFVDAEIRDTLFPLKGRKKKAVEQPLLDTVLPLPEPKPEREPWDEPKIEMDEDWF